MVTEQKYDDELIDKFLYKNEGENSIFYATHVIGNNTHGVLIPKEVENESTEDIYHDLKKCPDSIKKYVKLLEDMSKVQSELIVGATKKLTELMENYKKTKTNKLRC